MAQAAASRPALTDLFATEKAVQEWAQGAQEWVLDERRQSDLFLLASGAFSPLDRFQDLAATVSVLDRMRLPDGSPWSIPVLFPLFHDATVGERLALRNADGALLGAMQVEEVFELKPETFNEKVFRTTDLSHPGARLVAEGPQRYASGALRVLAGWLPPGATPGYPVSPAETRAAFRERGWTRVTAFQTRNPIHRAHEFCIKTALESSDGIVVHPLVGETKGDDIPAAVRMRCYEALLQDYFPADRAMIALYPGWMRYAGPREAIFHALVRRNYGFTHFIVGRDHAGVGKFYGPFDAQKIFSEFAPGELGIEPVFFDTVFYCRRCAGMASNKTCPHPASEQVSLSGTQVRELLRAGTLPPPEFSRPEVARILIEAMAAQPVGVA